MPLPNIHVIGDSHSRLFNIIPGCKVHHIGPCTMYGLRNGIRCQDTRIPLDIGNFGVKAGEYIVYVFGEIDVRTHIGRIRDKLGCHLDDVLDDLVKHYIDLIITNQEQRQCFSVIAAIVPPCDFIENPDFPFYGPIEERVMIQQQLNTKLKLACQEKNLLYLDYVDMFCNPDGTLKYEMSDGHVHLNQDCAMLAGEKLYQLVLRHKKR